MKKKNPFKKQSLTDTLVNVGIGGAGNVAMDYVLDMLPADSKLDKDTINLIKIGVGAVVGGMITNKYARAAADGIAVVGVSNLISGMINSEETKSPSGLPEGTIGAIRRRSPRVSLGNNYFKRSRRVSGVGSADSGFSVSKIMEK